MQELFNKLEITFYHDNRFYIARQIDHRAVEVVLTDPCRLAWKVYDQNISYSSNSVTLYQMCTKFNYELVGVLKFLHNMKEALVPKIVEKGADPDQNWAIVVKTSK